MKVDNALSLCSVSLSHAHAQIGLSLKLIKADMQTTTTGSLGGR